VRRLAYQPYGADVSVAGTWTTTTPLKFAGGEHDTTGLYHFGQRYHDPIKGRWTQQDPLIQPADLRQANRYTYVGNDPVNLVDPTGRRYTSEDVGDDYAYDRYPYSGRIRDDYKVYAVTACAIPLLFPSGRVITWIGRGVGGICAGASYSQVID
jgi:RHS repeat-associated protein